MGLRHRRRRGSRLPWVVAAIAVAVAGAGIVAVRGLEPPPSPFVVPGPLLDDTAFVPDAGRPFSANSPFNDLIGPTVRVDPNSGAMAARMTGEAPSANVYDDVPPIYDAQSSTPRYPITCTMSESWGPCPLDEQAVPIPDGAVASSGSDDNMVVVDWEARKAFGFWQYREDRATASWGEVVDIDGYGDESTGATGSGISRLAGVVRTYEVRQGRITHAMVGATGNACRTFRYPAVKSDGWSEAPDCLPQGARVQLDPTVDCAALPNITRIELMVCRAMQEYGWYNIDNGERGRSWFGIQFENPAGEPDPYPDAGVSWDHMPLTAIPWNRLRVLESWDGHSADEQVSSAPSTTSPNAPVASTGRRRRASV